MFKYIDHTVENVEATLSLWNKIYPDRPLTVLELKKPHAVMSAMLHVFDRLGINQEAVTAPPPEESRNKSVQYYWDLLPVINMVRVTNGVLSEMQFPGISIEQLLKPSVTSSHSILLLLWNLMAFKDEKLKDIEPYEEELFFKIEQVKTLEKQLHKLKELLNKQAQEKGERADRLVKLDHDIRQFEEELKQEQVLHDEEKEELDALLKENHQTSKVVEQKKTLLDGLLAEAANKKALRVYDADDIRAQAEQATQSMQEEEEKLNSLRATLMQKENSLKNLQKIKPSLDTANNFLREITKLSESLKDLESGDIECDGKDDEIVVLNTDLSELQEQLSELQTAHAEAADRRRDNCHKRQQEKTALQSTLREAEEKDRNCQERCNNASQRIEEIKQIIPKYEEQKSKGKEELVQIENDYHSELKSLEEQLVRTMEQISKTMDIKLKNMLI